MATVTITIMATRTGIAAPTEDARRLGTRSAGRSSRTVVHPSGA